SPFIIGFYGILVENDGPAGGDSTSSSGSSNSGSGSSSGRKSVASTVFSTASRYSLVMEYASLGSLFDYYRKTSADTVPIGRRLSLLHQVSMGMAFLHNLGILHHDLKSMNVLLTRSSSFSSSAGIHDAGGDIIAKISDFGLSKLKNEIRSRSTFSSVGGTPFWMAPELASVFQHKKKVSKSNDVFSFAVLLTEVVSWVGVFGMPIGG
ncbi:kinase-like domain-containing protein, partial [Zopfochytrium polystomum]